MKTNSFGYSICRKSTTPWLSECIYWVTVVLACWMAAGQECMGAVDPSNNSCTVQHCTYFVGDNSTSSCFQCELGYKPGVDGQLCQRECRSGSYIDNQTLAEINVCKACSDYHCLECGESDGASCEECLPGFYFNSQAICVACEISECLECSQVDSQQTCLQCALGRFISGDGSECLPLPPGVLASEYYDDRVYECPAGCQACTQNYTCEICLPAYYLDPVTQICLKCTEPNCRQCQSYDWSVEDVCVQCSHGFTILTEMVGQIQENQASMVDNFTRTCVKCQDEGCLVCLQEQPSTCIECIVGFYAHQGQCVACPHENCRVCRINEEEEHVQCLECTKGFTLTAVTPNQQLQCVSCLSGCGVCNAANLGQCEQCLDGYYQSALVNEVCQPCPSHCVLCTSNNGCMRCREGFRLNEVNMCSPIQGCGPFCLDCGINGECLNFMGGYPVAEYQTSSGKEEMYPIPRGYYLHVETVEGSKFYSDYQCSSIANEPHCSDCRLIGPNQVCSRCVAGFYLTPINTCSSCGSDCLACIQEEICLKCADGFWMPTHGKQGTGICLPCDQDGHSCRTCGGSARQCTSCIQGFFLLGHNCVSEEHIHLTLHLSMSLDQFPANSESVKQAILNIADPDETDTNRIAIMSLKEGSTIAEMLISVSSDSTAENYQQALKEGLVSDSPDFPFTLENDPELQIRNSKGDTEDDDDDDDDDDDERQTNKVGIIVSMIIIGILLVFIVFIAFKSRRDRKRMEQDQQNVENEKHSTGSSKRRRSRKRGTGTREEQKGIGKIQSGSDLYSEDLQSY